MEELKMDDIISYCEQRENFFDEYTKGECKSRFSEENGNNFFKEYWGHRKVKEYLEELKQYREKEKQGLLVKLPCKAGDIIWFTTKKCNQISNSIPLIAYPCKVKEIRIKSDATYFCCDTTLTKKEFAIWGNNTEVSVDEIGKTIFLTEREAEESLRKE